MVRALALLLVTGVYRRGAVHPARCFFPRVDGGFQNSFQVRPCNAVALFPACVICILVPDLVGEFNGCLGIVEV
eukprot:87663-Lingulodinium_polyedra.AAC.1